jgi:hypothetical protein
MQSLEADYFAAYRSLKLTRDFNGVLVVEFHSNGGPFIFTAQRSGRNAGRGAIYAITRRRVHSSDNE